MDLRQTVMGIVIFLVFWAFQNGYFNALGSAAWFVGIIIFSVLLFIIGKLVMPKPDPMINAVWMFSMAFAIVGTFIISFLGPSLGAVIPAGATPAQLTPLVLSFWLVLFGAALFVTGQEAKKPMTTLFGVIWLFSALHFVTAVGTGPNSYLHFGFITGLSYILGGLLYKK